VVLCPAASQDRCQGGMQGLEEPSLNAARSSPAVRFLPELGPLIAAPFLRAFTRHDIDANLACELRARVYQLR